jgi:Mn-dependent DtxR family transcriptional regulator
MSQKGTTPDERLLRAIYDEACKKGDSRAEVLLMPLAAKLGIKETALKNIVKHLAQANFLKKEGERAVYLTDHGEKIAKSL